MERAMGKRKTSAVETKMQNRTRSKMGPFLCSIDVSEQVSSGRLICADPQTKKHNKLFFRSALKSKNFRATGFLTFRSIDFSTINCLPALQDPIKINTRLSEQNAIAFLRFFVCLFSFDDGRSYNGPILFHNFSIQRYNRLWKLN